MIGECATGDCVRCPGLMAAMAARSGEFMAARSGKSASAGGRRRSRSRATIGVYLEPLEAPCGSRASLDTAHTGVLIDSLHELPRRGVPRLDRQASGERANVPGARRARRGAACRDGAARRLAAQPARHRLAPPPRSRFVSIFGCWLAPHAAQPARHWPAPPRAIAAASPPPPPPPPPLTIHGESGHR